MRNKCERNEEQFQCNNFFIPFPTFNVEPFTIETYIFPDMYAFHCSAEEPLIQSSLTIVLILLSEALTPERMFLISHIY